VNKVDNLMEPMNIAEPEILLYVNRLYRRGMSGTTLYEVTRGVRTARRERNVGGFLG
jgi:hypothetical protein